MQTVRKPSSLAPLKMFSELCEPKVPMASFFWSYLPMIFCDVCVVQSCNHFREPSCFYGCFDFHSDSSARTHFHTVLVLHVGRGWLHAGATGDTGANVENVEFQIFGDRALQCEQDLSCLAGTLFCRLARIFQRLQRFSQSGFPAWWHPCDRFRYSERES